MRTAPDSAASFWLRSMKGINDQLPRRHEATSGVVCSPPPHTIWSAQAPGCRARLTLLLLNWLVPSIPSAASVLVLSHRAEIEAVRTSTQHRQAREKERLQGIKEDEEMQDEAVPKQVVPFVSELSALASCCRLTLDRQSPQGMP